MTMNSVSYEPVVIDLPAVPWQAWTKPGANGSVKLLKSNGKRIRLLELPAGFDEQNWCTVGHQGYVLEGEFTIIFEDKDWACGPGMAFSIPDGVRHRSRSASQAKTLVFVIDNVLE